jgi:hypothetical protein
MTPQVIKVNNQDIQCPVHEGEKYVAIRPICDILGIDYRKQFERIKSDELLNQLVTHTVTSSAKDKKEREMFCLPVKYIFGWIFSIDADKVNEKSKPTFMKYKKECSEALYTHFISKATHRDQLLKEKANIIRQRKATEAKLLDNPDYIQLQYFKAEEMRISKPLLQQDRETLNAQLLLEF